MGEALKISKYGASRQYVLDRLIFKEQEIDKYV
uniref:Uncharacterized protein n=1 Tax=Vitis vinifera TaxID=29760 RepID=F6HAM8_VITVI